VSKMPKLYAPVWIKFGSLRMAVGANLGVMEVDAEAIRKCRRVATSDGWKWQIIDFDKINEWDYSVRMDRDSLDAYGSETEYEIVKKPPTVSNTNGQQ